MVAASLMFRILNWVDADGIAACSDARRNGRRPLSNSQARTEAIDLTWNLFFRHDDL
jgi:hypothetical protein